jgi:ethanolamine ammonia-lyase large subunit
MRQLFGLKLAPEFLTWLKNENIMKNNCLTLQDNKARHKMLGGLEGILIPLS